MRYSVVSPVFGFTRITRSDPVLDAHPSPRLSGAAAYADMYFVEKGNSRMAPVFESKSPTLSPQNSPNQNPPSSAARPRRGAAFGVGVGYTRVFPVFPSTTMMFEPWMSLQIKLSCGSRSS